MSDFGEEFEYAGDCCVCHESVNHSEAGFCVVCKGVFHWSRCGEWGVSGHLCENCDDSDN